MKTKETPYQAISALAERFDEQKASCKKSEYNETLVRRDFIDPFFKALVGMLTTRRAMPKPAAK